MKIDVTTAPSHVTLVLRGEFETEAADSFLAAIEKALATGQPHLVVSFRYVKYVNSTALGAVVRARGKCREQGGELVVLQPSKLTRDTLVKMGLDTVLKIVEDEQGASACFAAAAPDRSAPAGRPAPAAAPANTATGDPDRVSVMFSFGDERAQMIPGKSKHGVGVLASVDANTLVFHWQPGNSGVDASAVATMFRSGSSMRAKLQLKLIRKEFFEADATIDRLINNSDGSVTVRAIWSRIAAADQDALRRHGEELAYLKMQADA